MITLKELKKYYLDEKIMIVESPILTSSHGTNTTKKLIIFSAILDGKEVCTRQPIQPFSPPSFPA